MFLSTSRKALIRAVATASSSTSTAFRSFASGPVPGGKNVVVVSGVRLPFATASSIYEDEMAVDLQRLAITGLINQTAIPKDQIDYVICGNVIQEVRTSNIAREAAVNAGLPYEISAHTVAQACISANAAIATGATAIQTGHADVVIAGGVETFSDVPIRLSRKVRQKLITMPKAMKKGGAFGAVRHMLKGLSMKDLALETPAIANYTTGEVMGVSSDKLSAKFGVSREEQDQFTVRSHILAQKAHDDGFYNDEIVPYKGSITENGIKGDSTMESVGSKLFLSRL
jgi:acetyl-CoA acyltransferase